MLESSQVRIEGIDGIFNLDFAEKSDFIQRKADDNGRKYKLKKGDSLYIIVEMEEDVYMMTQNGHFAAYMTKLK